MNRFRRNKGYTLVELLVVTALVAILSSLALPSYSVIKRSVYNGVALSDLVNLRTALGGEPPNMGSGTTAVVGPAAITGIPGVRVSKDVTVTFSIGETTQITTTHLAGSVTYTLLNDKITP